MVNREYELEYLEKFDSDSQIDIDILRDLAKMSRGEKELIFNGIANTDTILLQFNPDIIARRIKKYHKDNDYLSINTLRKIIDLPYSSRKQMFDGEYELEKIIEKFPAIYIKYVMNKSR